MPPSKELSFEPYRERAICFLEIWRPGAWQMKVYGVSAHARAASPDLVSPEVLEAAKATALRAKLAAPPQGDETGLGFIIVHQGLAANWLLLDWWANGIWLYQQLYRSPIDGPAQFERVESDLVACIWELEVVEFERSAWIEKIMRAEPAADVAGYLGTHLTAMV